jgi:hypothetical protein
MTRMYPVLPVLMVCWMASLVFSAGAAQAETVYSGVLSPRDAEVFCSRVNKPVDRFGDGQYGCVASRFRIACSADLNCVAVTRSLDPNLSPIDAWLGEHGFHRMARTSDAEEN